MPLLYINKWDSPYSVEVSIERGSPNARSGTLVNVPDYLIACLALHFLVSFSQMKNQKKKETVFQILCPCCQSFLWIDSVTQEVVQSEKGAGKKKKSLDDLLMKEKKRTSEFDRKFEATAELEKKKKEKTEEGFKKALTQTEKED